MSAIAAQRAVRGRFLDIQHTVCQAAEIAQAVRYIEDGLLITTAGKITWFGPWQEGQHLIHPELAVTHYPEQLIVPLKSELLPNIVSILLVSTTFFAFLLEPNIYFFLAPLLTCYKIQLP